MSRDLERGGGPTPAELWEGECSENKKQLAEGVGPYGRTNQDANCME